MELGKWQTRASVGQNRNPGNGCALIRTDTSVKKRESLFTNNSATAMPGRLEIQSTTGQPLSVWGKNLGLGQGWGAMALGHTLVLLCHAMLTTAPWGKYCFISIYSCLPASLRDKEHALVASKWQSWISNPVLHTPRFWDHRYYNKIVKIDNCLIHTIQLNNSRVSKVQNMPLTKCCSVILTISS